MRIVEEVQSYNFHILTLIEFCLEREKYSKNRACNFLPIELHTVGLLLSTGGGFIVDKFNIGEATWSTGFEVARDMHVNDLWEILLYIFPRFEF